VSSPDILKYLEDVADKYNLRKYVTCGRKVVGAEWHDDKQKWIVKSKQTDGRRTVVSSNGITDGEVGDVISEECDVFINASGYYNHWRWPSTPGRSKFRGQMLHSADYDPAVDLKGKRVAVIGNGSSGIQIVSTIQKVVDHLTVYIRSPTWITANVASTMLPPSGDTIFTQEQKKHWADHPDEYLTYRKALERELNDAFPYFIRDTKLQKDARSWTEGDMKSKLAKRPDLLKLILPTFSVGCRRPTPGNGYLEALCADNVEVIWGELESFTRNGIKSDDGNEREFDVIICATGFNMSM
jgi:cation diffusion facilitator CzcD-associated flavoprotein CzcO